MFRTTVRADQNTDVDAVVRDLRARCEGAGIAPLTLDFLIMQTREILLPLVERGKQLASQGSQISVTRDVVGDGYVVRLEFGAGVKRSFWQRILSGLRGQ